MFLLNTGRKLKVHQSFRKRPRRFLNVLCTSSLSPVFRGLSVLQIGAGIINRENHYKLVLYNAFVF